MEKKKKKIYWIPSRLIEDVENRKVWVLLYGGSGRVRFVESSEIQGRFWDEERFRENH